MSDGSEEKNFLLESELISIAPVTQSSKQGAGGSQVMMSGWRVELGDPGWSVRQIPDTLLLQESR